MRTGKTNCVWPRDCSYGTRHGALAPRNHRKRRSVPWHWLSNAPRDFATLPTITGTGNSFESASNRDFGATDFEDFVDETGVRVLPVGGVSPEGVC